MTSVQPIKPEEFLFEIGTEELPVSYIQGASSGTEDVVHQGLRFKECFEEIFTKARIPFSDLIIGVTPRRLTFSAKMATRQTAEKVTFRGPSFEKAFDEAGKPTAALKGFLESRKAKVEYVRRLETDKGVYAAVEIEQESLATTKLLEPLLCQLLGVLPFPKRMRWENAMGAFPRPIRWFVLYFGKKLIPFQYGTLASGNTTRGHRFLFNKPLLISQANFAAYHAVLKRGHVLLDQIYPNQSPTQREGLILKQIKQKLKNTAIDFSQLDVQLVKEIANLVEEPHVFVGDFKRAHLSLPQEVLSASMKKHQRVLACYDKKGRILNHFIAVTNGSRSAVSLRQIRKNFENVLEAKLRDAAFFHEEDRKTTLAQKNERLKNVVFLGKLGSVYDKIERLQAYGRHFAEDPVLTLSEVEQKDLIRAASLAKADLVTQMVYEFPELQGVMGRHYAIGDGEGSGVSDAILEHYLPRFRGDQLPKTRIGAALAVFDKMDTFCGAFASGFIPSGSQDPYALRRAVMGIVRILKEKRINLSIYSLISFGLSLYQGRLSFDLEKTKASMLAFFKERLQYIYEEALAHQEERILLEAAMRASFDRLVDLDQRVAFLLTAARDQRSLLEKAAKVCERTANILKSNQEELSGDIREDLLESPAEKELFLRLRKVDTVINSAYENGELSEILATFGNGFFDPLNAFFDQVMVNVDNNEVRCNRKKLMARIHGLFATKVADLSFVRF